MFNNRYTLLIFLIFFSSQNLAISQTLESELQDIMTEHDVMGLSVVVFCQNGITKNIALGKSNFNLEEPMHLDSKYRIASISKTITAIAAMQLVEQNQLDLDEDISTILGYNVKNPNFPNSPITTRMLLSHKSSIIDGSTYNSFLGATVNDNPIPNLSELLTPGGTYYTAAQFNNIEPGTYFNYSNANYVILGTIIEKVSKQRFDEYCKSQIFDVLEIDASFNVNHLEDISDVAVLYRKPNGIWTPQIDNYLGVQPEFSNLANYTPGTNGGRFGPQGGLRCSAQDLAKIFLCLMNDGTFEQTILTPNSVSQMLENEWTYNGSNGNNYFGLFRSWGLGIHRITSTPGNDIALSGSSQMFGHAGEAYCLVSDAYFDTIRKLGFVFMNNGVGTGYQSNANSVFYTIEQDVFEAIENFGELEVCLTAGNPNLIPIPVLVFPNPSKTLLRIEGLSSSSAQNYRIFSSSGKLEKQGEIDLNDSAIDIQALSSGAYFLEIIGQRISFIVP
jgi:CubicO group peptidase (beta-lactamase class C family)